MVLSGLKGHLCLNKAYDKLPMCVLQMGVYLWESLSDQRHRYWIFSDDKGQRFWNLQQQSHGRGRLCDPHAGIDVTRGEDRWATGLSAHAAVLSACWFQGASVFCIITKMITTEKQVQGYCPEVSWECCSVVTCLNCDNCKNSKVKRGCTNA